MNKVLYIIIISLFSFTVFSCGDEEEESTTDTTAPVIAEVTAVTTPTNDSTPDYTFSSDEAGTITYGGSCSSSTTSAISGNNTITLVSLSDGTYSDCTIIVTDAAGNVSNTRKITSFTVDAISDFISVGESGTILTSSEITSTDGTSWTSRTSGTSNRLRGSPTQTILSWQWVILAPYKLLLIELLGLQGLLGLDKPSMKSPMETVPS